MHVFCKIIAFYHIERIETLPSLANRKQKFDVINFKLWLPAPIRSINMWFMVFSGLPFFLRRNTICEENCTTFSHVVESFQFAHKCIVRFARTSQTKHWARWVNRIWHLLRVFIINYVCYFAYHNFCIGCSHAVMCVPVCFVETREEKEAKKITKFALSIYDWAWCRLSPC